MQNAGWHFAKVSVFLFLTSPLHAIEYSPWFTPPFEFQSRLFYGFEREHEIQTPEGSFSVNNNIHLFYLSLGVTPWCEWNVEAELRLAHTTESCFLFEAFVLHGRYAWMDDTLCDPFSFVTGVTLFFAGDKVFHDFAFWYHGTVNAEFHATLGKEIGPVRLFVFGGIGFAERGSPWVHWIGQFDWEWNYCYTWSLWVDSLYGLGHQNIIPDEPFDGYARIDHRSYLLGTRLSYEVECFGSWSIWAWYVPYAHNFPEHNYGVALSLLIPFSL